MELSSWTEELPADKIWYRCQPDFDKHEKHVRVKPSQDTMRNSTGNQDMKTAKVAQWAEFTFDVDGTGTDGREGLEDKSSSETSGQSFELASNNVNTGMSPSCEQI